MHTLKQAKLIQLFTVISVLAGYGRAAQAKSVYVITDRASTVKAYRIQDDQITYQTTAQDLPQVGDGAVGLALDPDSETLFVTYERSNIIEMVNAKTMVYEDKPVTVPSAPSGGLAGIAFDQTKQKLYVVGRNSNKLYVYLWDSATKTLTLEGGTYKTLADLPSPYAYGLALDETNDRLYVTNGTSIVHYYDTNDPNWARKGSINIVVGSNARIAIGIAIDSANHYMYTGMFHGEGSVHTFLVRTDISDMNNPSSTEKNIGAYVIGIAADEKTGLVYITTYNNHIEVHNPATWLADPCDTETQGISGPADIVLAGDVGYKPPDFILVKDSNDPNNDCVQPWNSYEENYLVYDICYDANGNADTNVVIIDYLPPPDDNHALVTYYSSDPCGTYDANEHTVTWKDINDLGANDSNCITLRVKVTDWVRPGESLSNLVIMEGDNYYNEARQDVNVCSWTGEIIYVDKDADGYKNGVSWDDAYTNLQDALAGARNCGDSVTATWVAEGTYKPVWDMGGDDSYKDESFELVGGIGLFGHFGGIGTYETSASERNLSNPTNETILDGQIGESQTEAVYNVVTAEGIQDAMINGFTVTGSTSYSGAGILLDDSHIAIVNCRIVDNRDCGVKGENNSCPSLYNCVLNNNDRYNLYFEDCNDTELSNCVIDGTMDAGYYVSDYAVYSNRSEIKMTDCNVQNHFQSGISAYSSDIELQNCTIKNSYGYSGDCGGCFGSGSDIIINHCLIERTVESFGIWCEDGCTLTLTNSVIRWNGSSGIYLQDTLATTIKNNWIHSNGSLDSAFDDSGICFLNQVEVPLVRNNTICDNWYYGIASTASGEDPNIVNCIIYKNWHALYKPSGDFNSVNYCCLQDAHDGQGNIVADPCFINPTDADDLHISEDSRCVDAGDPNFNDPNERDIDGEKRVVDGDANGTVIVDMGADEYYWSPADFDANEIVNFLDYAMFADNWLKTDEANDYNDIYDLADDNNSIDFNDLDLFCEDWLWEAGWKKSFAAGFGRGMGAMRGMGLELQEAAAALYGLEAVITPETEPPQIEPADLEEITEWLEELWLTDEDLRELTGEDQWQEFIEAIEESIE